MWRLPIMWAVTNPMNRMPVTATRIFLPMVVWMADGSRSVAVAAGVSAEAVAVMTRSLSSPGRLLRRLREGRFDGALVAVGALEVRAVEEQLDDERPGGVGCHRLDGADAHARVGRHVAL